MNFRKRPIVIEATQFFRDRQPWPAGVKLGAYEHKGPCIETLEGTMAVSEGDWIITGVKGERYPCKPDIFAATYEAVEP